MSQNEGNDGRTPVRTQSEWDDIEGRLEWVTAWALRALDAMARVAPDAPRFNELEDDWDQFSYREVSWFRERAARLAKDSGKP